jgi:uncharacterized membrane protein YdbT with pleckstrin-like domain
LIYESLRSFALTVLRAPKDPPEPPAGTHASIEVFRASPRFLTYRLLLFFIGLGLASVLVVGFAISALASGEPGLFAGALGIAALCAALLLPVYFSVRIDYDLRYYVLTDRSLRVREGALIVREMTITHANVQNLKVKQGPLQRLLRIADLQIETAGGGGASPGEQAKRSSHTVSVAGIENAREVRDEILGYLRGQNAGAGLGDPDDERAAQGFVPSPEIVSALEQLHGAAAALRRAARA